MNKNYYIATHPDSGWDCVRGLFLAINEDEVYKYLCEERYGYNYSESDMQFIQDRYIITLKGVNELFTQAEIRDAKIEQIIKDE